MNHLTTHHTPVIPSLKPSSGLSAYAIVDVETSGFHPPKAEIVEIAIVHIDHAGQITGSWDTLIRPSAAVGPTRIHGISQAMVRDAPSFASIAPALHSLLVGRVVVAHNLPFDAKFLVSQFAQAGIAATEIHDGACTLSLAKRYIAAPRHQLADCCQYAAIELVNAHTAIGDATATAKLAGYFLRCGVTLSGRRVQPSSLFPAQREPVEKLLRPRVG